MLIFRFMLLFLFTTKEGLNALMLKKHISFSFCPLLQLWLRRSCLFKAPPPEYTAIYDWSAHTCLSQHHQQQQQSSCAEFRRKICKCVTLWCSVMSQSHGIQGEMTDEVFQEQRFLRFKIFYVKTLKGQLHQFITLKCVSRSWWKLSGLVVLWVM